MAARAPPVRRLGRLASHLVPAAVVGQAPPLRLDLAGQVRAARPVATRRRRRLVREGVVVDCYTAQPRRYRAAARPAPPSCGHASAAEPSRARRVQGVLRGLCG
jgi:hypothetical protein